MFAVVRSSKTIKKSYVWPKQIWKQLVHWMNFVWLFSYKFRHTAIHFELWENRKRFATFFMIKSTFWSTILDHVVFSMNEIIAGSIFTLSTADDLYCICIRDNMCCNCISCFDQDMAIRNNVNTLEKTSQNMSSVSKSNSFFPIHPLWQLIRPWFSLVPGFSLSADSCNYGHDVLGDLSDG